MLRSLARLFTLLDPSDRRRLAQLVLLGLFASVMETVGVGALLPFISIIADPGIVDRQPWLSAAYAASGCTSHESFLRVLGLAIIGLVLLKNLTQYVNLRLRTRFVYRQQAALASRMMEGYMRAPWWWRIRRNSADLANAIRDYPDVAFGVVTNAAMEMIAELMVLAAMTALLTAAAPMVMLVLAVLVAGLAVVFQRFFPRRMGRLGSEFAAQNAESLRRIQEGLGSAKEVRLLGREGFFVERFSLVAHRRAANQSDQEVMRNLPRQVLELVLTAGLVLAALLLLAQGRSPAMVVSVLGVFAVAAFRLMPSFNRLVAASNNLQYGLPMVVRTLDEMAALAELHERSLPVAADAPRPRLVSTLTFDNVTFRYDGSDNKPQLDELSLAISRGQSVGLVGASGAGKSTLVDLAMGLLAPSSGRILADGIDISSNLAAWQRQIGFVPQSIYLTDDTLRRNVAFGVPDSEIDDERLHNALAKAQLNELVRTLPNGVDTLIGEMGGRMSGGQRQRVGIARALYNDPELLVMDEATSALDSATEKEIGDALASLRGQKTVLLIAHRLSTVRLCDRIFLLEHGRLAASGNFEELVAISPSFRRMVELADLS